jgi:hypothetical protein
MREFGESRAEYYRAARRDLGIAGGLPPTSTPSWKAALAQKAVQPVGPAVTGDATRGTGSASGDGPMRALNPAG